MKKIIFITITLCLAANAASAQLMLSARDCREMALENSADMEMAAYRYDMAVADQKAVKANFFPKISGSAAYAYAFDGIDVGIDADLGALGIPTQIGPITLPNTFPLDFNISMKGAYMAGITLEQPVFVGGKIVTGNKMAKMGVDIMGEYKRLTRMNTIVEVEKAYWTYVSVAEKVKLLDRYTALLDSLYQNVSNFYELEMVTSNDLQKVSTKRSNIKYETQRAKSGLELTRMALCHQIGVDLATQIVATDTVVSIESRAEVLSPDIKVRPEYRMLQRQVEIKGLAVKNTRADFLPQLGIGAGYYYAGGINVGGQDFDMKLPMVIASLNIPIFHFGEGARKVKSAKLAHSMSQTELDKNASLMNIEMEQARTAYDSAFLLVETAQEGLKEAEKNLKLAQDNYELKLGTVIDVMQAQAEWQAAYSNDIEARANLKISEVEYLKANGQLE